MTKKAADALPAISTKRGDGGMTDLCFGGRVPKDHYRPEAYGELEEACAWLGLARAKAANEFTRALLLEVQRRLFIIGGEMAAEPHNAGRLKRRLNAEDLALLEAGQIRLNGMFEFPKGFVICGASESGALLDLARTVLRRAERRAVTLKRRGGLENEFILPYINRLSDVLWMLARYEEGEGDLL